MRNFLRKLNRALSVILVVLAVMALGIGLWAKCQRGIAQRGELEQLREDMSQQQETWRDEKGVLHARIRTLQSENIATFAKLEAKDSAIRALQQTVLKYKKKLEKGGHIIQLQSQTKVVETVGTASHAVDSGGHPRYAAHINLQDWVQADVDAGHDSTTLNLSIRNRYNVIIGSEYAGLFKPRRFYAEVENLNPYAEQVSIRAYSVAPPRRRPWHVGLTIGYGIGLFRQQPVLVPTISVGIQYSLVDF